MGGQAVFEGVMMRSPKSYSIAVRKPDGTIVVEKMISPGLRIDEPCGATRCSVASLLSGKPSRWVSVHCGFQRTGSQRARGKRLLQRLHRGTSGDSTGMMAMNIVVALSVFVLLFKFLPLVLATWLQNYFSAMQGSLVFSLVDGAIRLGIILYIVLVSQIRDIRRIFEYHGAEHKVVFTYEAQEDLTVDNARKHSTFHPRCGTSFLMVVMLISAVVYAFIPFESLAMKLLSRIILIPVIAGISYEIIRFAALRKITVLEWITLPGLWLQRVTTKQPDSAQLEIAIRCPRRSADPGECGSTAAGGGLHV